MNTPQVYAYVSVEGNAAPLVEEYNRLESLIPKDAPDDDPRWDALPETVVAGGPSSGHGDLATAAGARDLPFIAAAVNYVRAALRAVVPTDEPEAPTAEPLTPQEEARLRAWVANEAQNHTIDSGLVGTIAGLLATIDALRRAAQHTEEEEE